MGTYHTLCSVEYNLGLMEKQVRMLADLAAISPALHPPDDDADPSAEIEFVVVHRQRLQELVERLELEVGVMKLEVERLKN